MDLPVTHLAHQVASKALTWLHTHREHGALPPDSTAQLAEPDSVYKPLGETALAASLVVREAVAGTQELKLARELLDFCWEQLGEGSMLHERLLRYPLMSDPLETYAHFARSGYRHRALERLVAHTTSLRSARAVEVLPNRRLAVANAARVAGLDQGPVPFDWAALTRETWLGSFPEPWLVDWSTAYNMTHTVFHCTDWARVPTGLAGDLTAYVGDWLPVWTDIWAEIGEWDLMGELMIVGSCLDEPRCDAADWERLASLQHEDGLFPRDAQPVADDPAERFSDQHHPTVVAAIAGTLALSRTLGSRA
ncbi:DUF6895 family protein [Streptomyces liangshanensis]|uniref:DUF6895 domain-containing protein n=1 Tax=Streptomyces liangshanensis TaxID=2717324 RepID=A0A6G9GTN9_9ACTN|nr:hypothetical protein [Streptomyces liangshanensis]QIQ01307.1 hypothetical protein HA039_02465 [Streptomyces liangshanensis]